jgi:para-nitrobenzyl esterase
MNQEWMWNRRELLVAGTGLFVGSAAGLLPVRRSWAAEALSTSTQIAEPYVVVETSHGKLRGGHSRGALAFKGIPYGGPVAGAGRFKAAPPVEPWTGVRDALTLGTPAMQAGNTVHGEKPGENCLVLNVWTPALDGKKRPVVFYNHGGGFSTGSAGSRAQDGGQLAANHDVVVVASNHRLGIMGYLYLGEIGGEEYATSGNAGMLDIVAALKWVQQNIAAFGGDPQRVMVFGESGGGSKTSALMAMPSAKGLFYAAGIMSGPMMRVTEKERATATARSVLTRLNIGPNELHKLAEVPVEQLMAIRGGFSPVLDGTVISQHPFVPGPAPFVADIPLVVGNNRDEATYDARNTPEIFKMDEAQMVERVRRQLGAERADAVLPVFRRERPNATPPEIYIAIATARMWGTTIALAESKVKQNGAPVYMYRYDYPSNWLIAGTDWTIRAGHATDILAKFENADFGGLIGSAPDRFQAAHNIGESWANFARTGHPMVTGAPSWPAYDLQTRATMLLDVKCTLVNDPNKAEREIWQKTTTNRR